MTGESPNLTDPGWLTEDGIDGPLWPGHPDTEEQDLVRRAASGDRTAYGILYDRHFDGVYDFVFKVVGTEKGTEAVTTAAYDRDRAEIGARDPGVEPYHASLYRIAADEALRPPTIRARALGKLMARFQPPLEISSAWQRFIKEDRAILALQYQAHYTIWQIAAILDIDPEYVAQTIVDCRELLTSE